MGVFGVILSLKVLLLITVPPFDPKFKTCMLKQQKTE